MSAAGLYIRLSKEDEGQGESQSVQNQRSLLLSFARRQGLTVGGVYVDDGYSGTSFDRPAFRRMLADIEKGKLDTVLVKDLSRLGRDYILTGFYLERWFPEHGARCVSLLDGVDTASDSGANDVTPFRAVLNDMYARDISRKIRSVKRDKQKKGEFIGPKPVYGYKKPPGEKNRLVVDEEAAQVVRAVFSRALEGISCARIARELNEKGVAPPAVYAGLRDGGEWSAAAVGRMLQCRTYTGAMVQGRTARASYKSKKNLRRPPEDWIVVEGTHEPLIDTESFERAGELLALRRHTRTRKYDHPLKGLAYCRECGAALTLIRRRNAKGGDVLYFVCPAYLRGKEKRCDAHLVRAQTLAQSVQAEVLAVCGAYLDRNALFEEARQAVRRCACGAQAQARARQEKLARLDRDFDRLYFDRLDGTVSDADFARLSEKLAARRSALNAQEDEAEEPEQAEKKAERLVRRFLEDMGTQRAVLSQLVSRVELSADKALTIFFRFA